jgi:hypothetical protein
MRNDQNAFPVTYGNDGVEHGMTLRDYFAAAAMQGMLANNPDDSDIATDAYLIADDMMQVREEKK